MPSALSLPGNLEKIASKSPKDTQEKCGPGIGHAYFDCVRSTCRTLAALSGYGWLAGERRSTYKAPRATRLYPPGSELRCILQEIGNHALHLAERNGSGLIFSLARK